MNKVTIGPLLLGVAAVVVLITVVAGIMLVGSPAAERRRQADRRRVEDLQRVARAADVFWTRHGQLPASVADLEQEKLIAAVRDPETDAAYEFREVGANVYELCARFQGDSADEAPDGGDGFWRHARDRQCFRLEAKAVRR
jgi:hypothetical protein